MAVAQLVLYMLFIHAAAVLSCCCYLFVCALVCVTLHLETVIQTEHERGGGQS